LVQSHNSWVDLGRPSFWITLQISQFMVRSSFPVVFVTDSFRSSIHHCSITLGLPILFPTIPAIMRRVTCGLHAGRPGGHSNRVAGKVADGSPPLPLSQESLN